MTGTPARQRLDRIARVLALIFVLNVIVAVAKLAYGLATGAIALTADGVHSAVDAMSNVVGLIGVAVARRPPDANHPYGHRKYETFSALAVAGLLFLTCWEIGRAAVDRLLHPRAAVVPVEGFAVVALTLAINAVVAVVERREGRRLHSELLLSDAAHTMSDVFASLLVLASFVASRIGWAWADGVVAVVIIVMILRAGAEILRGTLSTLSDERRIPPADVEREALAEPGVREAHNVRSRGPLDDIHLDLHVLVDPALPIAQAHAIGHRVEARLRERWQGLTDVIVHVEPAVERERAVARRDGGLQAED
jgi:cation diffusion facilitator family transporter